MNFFLEQINASLILEATIFLLAETSIGFSLWLKKAASDVLYVSLI